MKKVNSDKFWEGVGALTVVGVVVTGAALLFELLFNTNSKASDSSSDSFSDGATDGILGIGRRSYDADYTAGYNVWSDD